ncbi:MAG: hypothetical protein OEN00_05030, partial [Gemmatimonadota bacterium]|nr:hypothetical protein [Gemmatimonadota bacterium]
MLLHSQLRQGYRSDTHSVAAHWVHAVSLLKISLRDSTGSRGLALAPLSKTPEYQPMQPIVSLEPDVVTIPAGDFLMGS